MKIIISCNFFEAQLNKSKNTNQPCLTTDTEDSVCAVWACMHHLTQLWRAWKYFTNSIIHQDQSIKYPSSYLPLGIGLFHDRQKSINLTWWRRGEVCYLDVVQLQVWAGVMVGWFSLTQANQVFDPIIQHVLVFTCHPGQCQSGHFAWFHPWEVAGSKWRHAGQRGEVKSQIRIVLLLKRYLKMTFWFSLNKSARERQ